MVKNPTPAPRSPAIKPETSYSPIDAVSEDGNAHAEMTTSGLLKPHPSNIGSEPA